MSWHHLAKEVTYIKTKLPEFSCPVIIVTKHSIEFHHIIINRYIPSVGCFISDRVLDYLLGYNIPIVRLRFFGQAELSPEAISF